MPPQDFHKAIYAERRVLEKYHRETTGDKDATVSEWRDSEEGNKQQRTVKYQVPLAVPVAIKKLIGMLQMISHVGHQAETPKLHWNRIRMQDTGMIMHICHKHLHGFLRHISPSTEPVVYLSELNAFSAVPFAI